MRLIIDVPDHLLREAFELADTEARIGSARDYRARYEKRGWGWTFKTASSEMWVRGIKGGMSVSLSARGALCSEPSDLARDTPEYSSGKVAVGL